MIREDVRPVMDQANEQITTDEFIDVLLGTNQCCTEMRQLTFRHSKVHTSFNGHQQNRWCLYGNIRCDGSRGWWTYDYDKLWNGSGHRLAVGEYLAGKLTQVLRVADMLATRISQVSATLTPSLTYQSIYQKERGAARFIWPDLLATGCNNWDCLSRYPQIFGISLQVSRGPRLMLTIGMPWSGVNRASSTPSLKKWAWHILCKMRTCECLAFHPRIKLNRQCQYLHQVKARFSDDLYNSSAITWHRTLDSVCSQGQHEKFAW